MSAFTSSGKIRLPQISADAFTCPTDKMALDRLQKTPVLPQLVKFFNEIGSDRFFYSINSAESVRCNEGQFRTLFGIMREAADILDIPEPELYIRYSARMNSYTSGVTRPFIVINSPLADSFTDEELLFIAGHELGHIKCSHVLYGMVGRMLIPLIQALGQATLGLGQFAGIAVIHAFYEWMRQAEFSCDRAGLLTCQNPRVAYSAIMKLGCGSTRFNNEMNLDAFLEQAREHTESSGVDNVSKALLYFMYNWRLSHPQVVYRAKMLQDWVGSGEFERILSGRYQRVYERAE